MPIIACVGMSFLIYLLLFYSLKKENSIIDSGDTAPELIKNQRENCTGCGKSFFGDWRFCPYCGGQREKR